MSDKQTHAAWLAANQQWRDALYGTDEPVTPDPTMPRRMEDAPLDGSPILIQTVLLGIHTFYYDRRDSVWIWASSGTAASRDKSHFLCWWPLSVLKVPDWARGGA